MGRQDTETTPALIEARRQRLAREAVELEAAQAQIDMGLFVEGEAVSAWIDSLGTANELPLPRGGRS